MSTRYPSPLDDREARLRSAGAKISVHARPEYRTGTTDLPDPSGFYCEVGLPDVGHFSGTGETRDDARAEAFAAAEAALGFGDTPAPRPKWTIVDQEPKELPLGPDLKAWTWVLRDGAGLERKLTAGVTRTAEATIEAGGPVSMEVLEAYETQGRSLIEKCLYDDDLPRERLIAD